MSTSLKIARRHSAAHSGIASSVYLCGSELGASCCRGSEAGCTGRSPPRRSDSLKRQEQQQVKLMPPQAKKRLRALDRPPRLQLAAGSGQLAGRQVPLLHRREEDEEGRENDQMLTTGFLGCCDRHINRQHQQQQQQQATLPRRAVDFSNQRPHNCSAQSKKLNFLPQILNATITPSQVKLLAVALIHLILLIQQAPNLIGGGTGDTGTGSGVSRGQVNADIFSSTSHLQNLMYLERHLIMSLGQYVVSMEQKLTKIRRYIDHWEATAGRDEFVGTFSEEEIIGNPLQAFQLVKRLTIDWKTISELFKQDNWNDVQRLTQDYKAIMPSDDDLHGAALAIVRLQDTYNLTERELAMGKIKDFSTRIQMTARDCLYLAKHAFNNAYYGHSLDWFEEALRRAYGEGNTTASVSEIQPFYQMAAQVVEQFRAENKGNSLDTYHIYMEASGSKEHSTKFKMLEDDNEDYRKYQALCRGEKRRTPAQEAPLRCYLRHNNHPLLYLQPIRLEVQNVKPFISIIHNLMTEKEADMIRELAAPMLTRARVQTDNGTADMVSKTRTSQTAWFSPDTHPIVNRMNRRIEAATGLSVDMTDSHCELMQVANYGMGGHYTPHYDYLIVDRPENERDQVDDRELYAGDRTATVMFYLKDVVGGGSTVFPRLGVHLKPELGAAAFWYNLYRNGEGIIETVHGACPVLMGEKWVANFWIRERGQFSKRRCTLDPKE